MITSNRSAAPLLLAALALSLAACQDPSGVGLSLIGDETSDPNAQIVSASSAEFVEQPLATGGFANGTGTPIQTRFFVGDLADPQIGDMRAIGYIDARAVGQPEGFGDRALSQVQIVLRRAVTYGDTLSDVPVEIREITENPGWSPDGLPVDTTLQTGDLITSATIPAQDTLVTLDLPAAFVAANTATLRDSLDALFEGFQLRVPEGMMSSAVVGFNASQSSIRLIGDEYVNDDDETTRDTVDYPLVEIYTALARGQAMESPGRRLIRGGSPAPLAVDFDLSEFVNLPLANARFRIPIDRTALQGSVGFNRPLLNFVTLYAVFDDDTRTAISTTAVPEEGDEIVFRENAITQLVQSLLLGRQTVDHFEIGVPASPLDLGTLPVIVEEEMPGEFKRPRLSLITVGAPA